MEGIELGPYRLLDELGRGGMGRVYRAYDTATDRIVALKVMPPELAGDAKYQKRFKAEARAAASLNEPHIVPIHGFGEIDGRLYVDMRLIDGRNLEETLRQGPLDPSDAVSVISQVAAALESLSLIAAQPARRTIVRSPQAKALRYARSCYDHLAGELGVGIASALETRGPSAGVCTLEEMQ